MKKKNYRNEPKVNLNVIICLKIHSEHSDSFTEVIFRNHNSIICEFILMFGNEMSDVTDKLVCSLPFFLLNGVNVSLHRVFEHNCEISWNERKHSWKLFLTSLPSAHVSLAFITLEFSSRILSWFLHTNIPDADAGFWIIGCFEDYK